jgi:hypothetical protein
MFNPSFGFGSQTSKCKAEAGARGNVRWICAETVKEGWVLYDLVRGQPAAVRGNEANRHLLTRYYDSLTDEEVAEDRAWGLFAETQMATDD